jgi:hypothetical protein
MMTRFTGTMRSARRFTSIQILRQGTFALAFASFSTMLASSASADVIGNVILQDYRGATATPDGAQEAKPIHYQDQVSALDTVETGEGGATSMRFLDETRFDVGPNAMVKLDDFVFDPASTVGSGQISMAVGAFRYVGGKMKSDENVKLTTPTATMTIRGTELVIFVGLDGTTEVNIVSGAVDVQPCKGGDAVAATAGQRVIIPLTCTTSVMAVRPLAEDLAALDVPGDLGDFATAAGGDDGGDGPADGGPGGDDRGGRKNDKNTDKDPEPAGPAPDPTPPDNEGPSGGTDTDDGGCEGGCQ